MFGTPPVRFQQSWFGVEVGHSNKVRTESCSPSDLVTAQTAFWETADNATHLAPRPLSDKVITTKWLRGPTAARSP